MKSFIFSSLADRRAAHLCRAHLVRLGAAAAVVMDANEPVGDLMAGEILSTFPRRGRLYGTSAAVGIALTLHQHAAGHEVVAKVDADMLLLPEAFCWLAAARERAHGYSVQRRLPWCGCYSAPAAVFPEVARILRQDVKECNQCGEDNLMLHGFRKTCGVSRAHADAVQVWRAGRALKPAASVITLPTGLGPQTRQRELAALFSPFDTPR